MLPPPAQPPPPEPPPSPSPPWWLEDCGAGSAPQQGDGCAKCPRGWHGTVDDRTEQIIRKCEPCPPNWLQPLRGQTACVPCPTAGVDCALQDRVEVLSGWYRAFDSTSPDSSADASLAATSDGDLELTFSVAGDLTDTTHATVEAGLRSYLQCTDPVCTVAMQLTAGSVHVVAAVNDSAAASVTAVVALTRMTDDALADALGLAIEGGVSITHGAAAAGLLEEGLRPTRCPERESCLGGHNSSCAEGHTGALCGTCEAGYFKSGGVCTQCDRDAAPSIALYVSAAALMLALAFTYMLAQFGEGGGSGNCAGWASRRAARSTLFAALHRRSQSIGTVAKIMLGYFQVLNTFSQLQSIRWPPLFASFLDALSPLSFQLFSVSPLGCRLDMEVTFVHELVATLLLPIAGAIVVLLVALLAAACRLPQRERGVIAVMIRPETCTMQLWMLLLLYPSLAKASVTPYDCVEVGGERLLRADPSVTCDDNAWRAIATLGAIGTLVYSLGFPLLCLFVARAAHRAHSDAAHPDDASASPGNASSRSSKHQGFVQKERRFARAKLLLQSYKAELWYWESLEMLRKYVLTSVVLVAAPDSLQQVFLGLLMCMAFVILLANRQPYESQLCGRLQLLALTQLTFTYMAGMLFFDHGRVVENEDAWGIGLVVVNTLMIAVLGAGAGGAVSGALRDVQVEQQLRSQLEQMLREVKGLKKRKVPKLDELAEAGVPVLNAPGHWHFMISYCQHARVAPTIATNLATYLRQLGYWVWLDVDMPRKDVAAMQEAVQNSMMVICILSSERPGDEFAYFMRPFCRKEMNWALANEEETGGRWSKIQPVVSVQDGRLKCLSTDLSDEHLRSGADPSSHMSREDVHSILDRDFLAYNTTDAEYKAVGHTKIVRLLEVMAGDRLSDEDARANAAADEEAKMAEDPTSLLATELGGATHHFALSFAADRKEVATSLSSSLSARGYTVRELPLSTGDATDQDVKAAIDGSVVLMPIISDGYVADSTRTNVLRWALETATVVQPVVHVDDKRKITKLIQYVPPFVRKKDWVDLHLQDADYWDCGLIKVLRSAQTEAAKAASERHDDEGAAAASTRLSGQDRPHPLSQRNLASSVARGLTALVQPRSNAAKFQSCSALSGLDEDPVERSRAHRASIAETERQLGSRNDASKEGPGRLVSRRRPPAAQPAAPRLPSPSEELARHARRVTILAKVRGRFPGRDGPTGQACTTAGASSGGPAVSAPVAPMHEEPSASHGEVVYDV